MNTDISKTKNEIILYQPDNNDVVKLEVRVDNETVWLSLNQMAELFGRDKSVISRHIRNIYTEQELTKLSTVANFATVQNENGRLVERFIEYYNLDMIISVGYRVKSQRGVEFRIWATKTLRDYVLKGYAVAQRFERLEYRVAETEKKIDFIVRTELPPKEGVFYNGQIFDAYKFVSDLIEKAQKEITIIDNYIDASILTLLTKRKTGVSATIYTKEISSALQLDLQKHNAQYPKIDIQTKSNIHDRFIAIDNDLYHIGASLKDLGKKLFAFSKMGMEASELLKSI